MKICRIVALLISTIMMLSLISCDQLHFHSGGGKDPHSDTMDDLHNNPPKEDEDDEQKDNNKTEEQPEYIYSVISKTLHRPDCYHVDRIKEEYRFTFVGDITVMLQKDYTICKDCLVPDDEKKEEDDDKEEENLIAKENATYATNKLSLVVHLLDCYMLESMIESNLRYTDKSYEELLELDYRPCGTCMPDEYKEYKKNNPDKFK